MPTRATVETGAHRAKWQTEIVVHKDALLRREQRVAGDAPESSADAIHGQSNFDQTYLLALPRAARDPGVGRFRPGKAGHPGQQIHHFIANVVG